MYGRKFLARVAKLSPLTETVLASSKVPRTMSKAARTKVLEDIARWAWKLRKAHMMDQRETAQEKLEELLDQVPEFKPPKSYCE